MVSGITDGGHTFLGIPFAAPPVGELRFRPPRPPACWTQPVPATSFASACLQKDFDQLSGDDGGVVTGSEDCLYLNVWTPALTGSRPVLVFIHGGGNQQGSAGQLTGGARLYDGQLLSSREDVVVVTVQYRLGPLGYLVAPGLSEGNLGLLDQQRALDWVRTHAARLGGDPSRVLLFGESAGAVNTCLHLVMPGSAGLFSRALLQSGACVATPLTTRLAQGQAYLEAVGCSGPDAGGCLSDLDASALLAPISSPLAGGFVQGGFGPTIDGQIIPEEPLVALAAGRHARVPVVVGVNADEMSVSAPPTVTPAMVELLYLIVPPQHRAAMRALYPPGTTGAEARASYVAILTDSQFVCTARQAARALASSGTPVHRSFFTHTLGGLQALFGAFHGIELFFVFGSLERSSYSAFPGLRQSDRDLVALTQRSWAAFAATGDPSTALATWPPYSAATDPYLELASPPQAAQGLRTARCDFWDAAL